MQYPARWILGLGGAVVLGLLGLLSLLPWQGRHDETPAQAPEAAASRASALPVAVPASVPMPAAAYTVPGYLRHFDPAMEVCLRPPMPLDAAAAAALAQPGSPLARYLAQQTDDLREHVIRRLAAGDDRARGAAALLRGDVAGLADIARRSEDGEIYGIALQACRGREVAAYMRHAASATDAASLKALVGQALAASEPNCEALSTRRWAQLQPDDAAPWLQMLDEARRAGDAAAVNEALYRAGHAGRMQNRWPWLAGQIHAVLPDDAPEGGRLMLLTEAIGRDGAMLSFSDALAAGKSCDGAALQDANRRQDCGQVARLLRERSDRLIDRRAGSRLAERLGLPPVQPDVAALDALLAHRAASDAEAMESARDACGALRALARQADEVARLGEWGRLTADGLPGKP